VAAHPALDSARLVRRFQFVHNPASLADTARAEVSPQSSLAGPPPHE
jgi:hypothetical protein